MVDLTDMSAFLGGKKAPPTSVTSDSGIAFGDSDKGSMMLMAGSLSEAKKKVEEMARKMGMPDEEIEKLKKKLEDVAEEQTEGKENRGFGVYNHSALVGCMSQEEGEKHLAFIRQKLEADPEATVTVRLKDLRDGLEILKRSYIGARQEGFQDISKVAEMGVVFCLWAAGFGQGKVPPAKFFERLCMLWAGAGPGEIDFRPVYDSDFPGILAAWLEFREGRIGRKEFTKRCADIRPELDKALKQEQEQDDDCQCLDCKTRRGGL